MATLKPHIALNVKDVDASTDFYKRMFRLEPVKVRKGYAKFDVASPAINFTLNQNPAEATGGKLSHLGIQVDSTDDVMAWKARWQEDGLATRDEEKTSCCYAVQDKTWVVDPDGNEWEVFVVLRDGLTEEEQAEANGKKPAGSCCSTAPDGTSTCAA